MKTLFFLMIYFPVFGFANTEGLNDYQLQLINKAIEFAANDVINEVSLQAITHQESNRLTEIVQAGDLNSKQIMEVHMALKDLGDLSIDQRQDMRSAIAWILDVRLIMEGYMRNYGYRCLWKIKENPMDLVAEDSPLKNPHLIKYDVRDRHRLKPIQPWERVVTGVCAKNPRLD